jgi:hypothetical protein
MKVERKIASTEGMGIDEAHAAAEAGDGGGEPFL